MLASGRRAGARSADAAADLARRRAGPATSRAGRGAAGGTRRHGGRAGPGARLEVRGAGRRVRLCRRGAALEARANVGGGPASGHAGPQVCRGIARARPEVLAARPQAGRGGRVTRRGRRRVTRLHAARLVAAAGGPVGPERVRTATAAGADVRRSGVRPAVHPAARPRHPRGLQTGDGLRTAPRPTRLAGLARRRSEHRAETDHTTKHLPGKLHETSFRVADLPREEQGPYRGTSRGSRPLETPTAVRPSGRAVTAGRRMAPSGSPGMATMDLRPCQNATALRGGGTIGAGCHLDPATS